MFIGDRKKIIVSKKSHSGSCVVNNGGWKSAAGTSEYLITIFSQETFK